MSFDEGTLILMAPCVRCGGVFASDPETVPSVWVNTSTRCPVRTDGTAIEPGEPGTEREPLCETCTPIVRAAVGRSAPVLDLFPLARIDLIHEEIDS